MRAEAERKSRQAEWESRQAEWEREQEEWEREQEERKREQEERKRKQEEREREQESMLKAYNDSISWYKNKKILIIFDTSSLMNKDLCLNVSFPFRYNYTITDLIIEPLELCELTMYIPKQVISELYNHFDNPDKVIKAKKARKLIIELKGMGAKEIDLSETPLYTSTSKIGADSKVDRQILGFAISKLEGDNKYDWVVVATEDGGIMYDIQELSNQGYNIYTLEDAIYEGFFWDNRTDL